ncbi:prenylcysteine oxidase 1-like [Ptiloglossa arizonensis]|uniref:prenylcysteine oxidase 1-like n=1 Tax=Ptiloglossa arizonensis TaxID=3350558 RepID=UPI003F9FF3C0
MDFHIIFLFILLLERGICFEKCKPNIAIIGGGIGGAATSHFLTELFHNNLNIDLYEAETIGGRLATVQIDNNEFEASGSIIHPENKYMQEFVKLLGLEHRPNNDERSGIWNGNEFVFEESNINIISVAKLLYKYGIQPFSLNRYINSIVNNFAKIYSLQDAGKSFENITSFLTVMNAEYPKLLQVSIKKHLLNIGYSEKIIDEIVKASLVVNYGQDTNVHSFIACVSLAGAGFDLWSVKGGNKKVPEHLIYRNKNVNIVSSRVDKIVYMSPEGFKNLYAVFHYDKDMKTVATSMYDIVIVATPLTYDHKFPIVFDGFLDNLNFYSPEKFHKTMVTFVKADLKPHYFGLLEEIDNILSCEPNKTLINSIGRLNTVEGIMKHSRIWKIFSNIPLKSEIINEMFSNINEVKEITWNAHPEYSTEVHEAKFKLHNALYYVNAIEWVASAMEMSAISGRNVAILAHEEFSQKCHRKHIKEMQTDVPKKISIEL